MAEIKNTEMIRDALGSPIPQKWDEESKTFIASTVDGSAADVDFSKTKLIRDRLGSPIPQKWDNDAGKFVPSAGGAVGEVTIESIPGLQTKLNETTVKLAVKLEKGQVTVSDIDKNKGLLDQTFLTDALKQQIAGTAPINAVPADNSLTTNKFSSKAVTAEKTNFAEVSKNLFNKDTTLKNKTLNVNREVVDSLQYNLSDFIPAEGNTQYTANKPVLWQKYSADKAPLGSPEKKLSDTTTSLTRFIRVAVLQVEENEIQVQKGSETGEYQPFGAIYIPKLVSQQSVNMSEIENLISEKTLSESEIDSLIAQRIGQVEGYVIAGKSPTGVLSFDAIASSPEVYTQNFKSQETGKIYTRGVAGVYEWNSIENNVSRLCGVNMTGMTGAIEYMHITSEFVVYVTRDIANVSTFIYRAANVDVVNPQLVHSYVGGYPTAMTCASYHDGIVDVILVSTYNHVSNPSIPLPLFMSKDKGLTWQKIHETPVTDNKTNSHWHSVAYDPYTGVIWASNGDGANRGINWSHDMGKTWDRINGADQPTMILPFPDRVIFGRDASTKKPGMDGYNKKSTAHEVALYDALTFRTDQPANWNYPQHNFWADTNIAYVLFAPTTPPLNEMQYIYATGDGGKTWHNVWAAHRELIKIDRITGISGDGYIVATVLGHSTIPMNRLMKAKAVDWV